MNRHKNPLEVLITAKNRKNPPEAVATTKQRKNPPEAVATTKQRKNPSEAVATTNQRKNPSEAVATTNQRKNPREAVATTNQRKNPPEAVATTKQRKNPPEAVATTKQRKDPPEAVATTKQRKNPPEAVATTKQRKNPLEMSITAKSRKNLPAAVTTLKSRTNPTESVNTSKSRIDPTKAVTATKGCMRTQTSNSRYLKTQLKAMTTLNQRQSKLAMRLNQTKKGSNLYLAILLCLLGRKYKRVHQAQPHGKRKKFRRIPIKRFPVFSPRLYETKARFKAQREVDVVQLEMELLQMEREFVDVTKQSHLEQKFHDLEKVSLHVTEIMKRQYHFQLEFLLVAAYGIPMPEPCASVMPKMLKMLNKLIATVDENTDLLRRARAIKPRALVRQPVLDVCIAAARILCRTSDACQIEQYVGNVWKSFLYSLY